MMILRGAHRSPFQKKKLVILCSLLYYIQYWHYINTRSYTNMIVKDAMYDKYVFYFKLIVYGNIYYHIFDYTLFK